MGYEQVPEGTQCGEGKVSIRASSGRVAGCGFQGLPRAVTQM